MRDTYRVGGAFAGFACLLAFRDIASEIWLQNEERLWQSFGVCCTILCLSVAWIAVSREFGLIAKLGRPRALGQVVKLGLLSGFIYLGIFYLIGRMGAGLWGLIDYGLIPLATAFVGSRKFKEDITIDFCAAFAIYVVGILLLTSHRLEVLAYGLLTIAVFLPLASAYSDGYSKWLLDPEMCGLTRSELLAVRFLPATVVLYLCAAASTGRLVPEFESPSRVLVVSVVGGWAPLMLLCTGLLVGKMQKLAVWEFTIPAVTFFGTLHLHPEHTDMRCVTGALLVLSGIVVSEGKLLSRIIRRSGKGEADPGS